MPRGKPVNLEAQLRAAERDAKACELRLQKWTYQEIADELGYGAPQNAAAAVSKRLRSIPRGRAQDLKAQMTEELQVAKEIAFFRGITHNNPLWATIYTKLASQWRILHGLDAPKQVSHAVNLSGVSEFLGELEAARNAAVMNAAATGSVMGALVAKAMDAVPQVIAVEPQPAELEKAAAQEGLHVDLSESDEDLVDDGPKSE